ncbi:hypothetical protein [Pyrodictium abyssi]|uniref:Bacterial Pleckstrin homology domain-containing protein n=1 Tax=Pyrodictium abyssi TaxID=54256 RepID=A0ABN6ZL54_9CREN|nr:hypothetical protein PABY_05520 [Pyrodictium abyssi]
MSSCAAWLATLMLPGIVVFLAVVCAAGLPTWCPAGAAHMASGWLALAPRALRRAGAAAPALPGEHAPRGRLPGSPPGLLRRAPRPLGGVKEARLLDRAQPVLRLTAGTDIPSCYYSGVFRDAGLGKVRLHSERLDNLLLLVTEDGGKILLGGDAPRLLRELEA